MLLGSACAGRSTPPDVSALTLSGQAAPSPNPNARATVLFFVAHDCPIANSYAPEINRIVAAYSPKRVAFRVVYVETDTRNASLAKHVTEYGFRCPAVHDARHLLAARVGATVTPEAVVLAGSGKILYRGRIDDRYAAFGVRRMTPKHRDLRAALDAVVRGQPVAVASTPALGCAIPPLP